MELFSIIIIGLGVFFLVAGRQTRQSLYAVTATPTLTCRDIAARAIPEAGLMCEIKGMAAAGPHGLVTSPFTKRECVWYRTKVSERYRGPNGSNWRKVNEAIFPDPFLVRDETGEILLECPETEIEVPQSFDRFERKEGFLSGGEGHLYEEWIVTQGQPIYALGTAHNGSGGLVMRKPLAGPFIVSTQSEQQVTHKLGTSSKGYRVAGVLLTALGAIMLIYSLFN